MTILQCFIFVLTIFSTVVIGTPMHSGVVTNMSKSSRSSRVPPHLKESTNLSLPMASGGRSYRTMKSSIPMRKRASQSLPTSGSLNHASEGLHITVVQSMNRSEVLVSPLRMGQRAL
ncbi:hypothetical protein BJ742DRAFT_818767 [Cladochytrium replicatum]|nr:hypothetical protein BJ742DRAFT_818767 [Cladochytrium replicatum]